jgi:acyl transferase domain-containing protein
MSRRVVFLYSGEGSQYFQMGRELFDRDPAFRRAIEECDALARPGLGAPLPDLIYGRPLAETHAFDRVRASHPALLAVQYATTAALRSRGLEPDELVGYSLGEAVAAVVSGAATLAEGMALVQSQARWVEERTPEVGAVAVLGGVRALEGLDEVPGPRHVTAINHDRHAVVAALPADLDPLAEALSRRGTDSVRVPINRGFHSPWIEPAAGPLRPVAEAIAWSRPRLRCWSCRTAAPLAGYDADHVLGVLREPIRFLDTIRRVAAEGPALYVDVGPAGTLAGFIRHALGPKAAALPSLNPFGLNERTIQAVLDEARRP